jgi:hypothetical protein
LSPSTRTTPSYSTRMEWPAYREAERRPRPPPAAAGCAYPPAQSQAAPRRPKEVSGPTRSRGRREPGPPCGCWSLAVGLRLLVLGDHQAAAPPPARIPRCAWAFEEGPSAASRRTALPRPPGKSWMGSQAGCAGACGGAAEETVGRASGKAEGVRESELESRVTKRMRRWERIGGGRGVLVSELDDGCGHRRGERSAQAGYGERDLGRVAARSAMDCPVTGDRTLAHGGCLRSSELRGSG